MSPTTKQLPEQESGNTAGKGIQQEEQQGGKEQVTGIHFDFDYGLSVEMTRSNVNLPGQQEGPPSRLFLNPQG